MASIKKDKVTGKWRFVFDLPRDPVTNKRNQCKRGGFSTRKEAEAKAAELLHLLTIGTHVEDKEITFEEMSQIWFQEYKALSGVKEGTIDAREYDIGVLLKYFKVIKLKNITKQMYQNAITSMKKSGLGRESINGIHGAARMIFRKARELDLIYNDPSEFAKLPVEKVTVEQLENRTDLPKYLEKEELAKFLTVCLDKGLDGDYEAFLTLAYTGMRCGELAVLRESDLNFTENTISITKTYYNKTNKVNQYKLETPKTDKSTRVIEVDQLVMDALKSYITKNKEFKMLYRRTYYDKGYVFPNKHEFPGYPKAVTLYDSRMRKLIKLSGLNPSITPHSLRHTHTSLLAEAAVPLEDIMDRLGHKDDKATRFVYLHVTKTRKKEAAQKFGDLMRNV